MLHVERRCLQLNEDMSKSEIKALEKEELLLSPWFYVCDFLVVIMLSLWFEKFEDSLQVCVSVSLCLCLCLSVCLCVHVSVSVFL